MICESPVRVLVEAAREVLESRKQSHFECRVDPNRMVKMDSALAAFEKREPTEEEVEARARRLWDIYGKAYGGRPAWNTLPFVPQSAWRTMARAVLRELRGLA